MNISEKDKDIVPEVSSGTLDARREKQILEMSQRLVDKDVYYCVSHLISELAKQSEYMDELMPVLENVDYLAAAIDDGCIISEIDGQFYWEEGGEPFDSEEEAAQSYCEENQLDPATREVYEHWIVSDWLAEQLAKKGESVLEDFLGLTIWGRTCSGMAIYFDHAFKEIAKNLLDRCGGE